MQAETRAELKEERRALQLSNVVQTSKCIPTWRSEKTISFLFPFHEESRFPVDRLIFFIQGF